LYCNGSVAAAVRRNGIGTRLLREVNALMHALDKSVLSLSAYVDAGHGFLTHMGATAKHSSLESRMLLEEVDWQSLRAWEDVAGELGLTFERYAGRVPRDVLAPLLPVLSALIADAPMGALEMPPIRLEIEGYDQWYENMERTGGAHHLILLRDPEGAVVGMTEASWDSRTPNEAYQMFTAIAPPWRGCGLARAVKAAMLRQVRASHPDAEKMITLNAESNAAMLSINKRLGYTVQRRHVDYQITRAELDARLGEAGV
jgi:RimJ/RimL family protein N-acetyltransferase